MGLSLGSAKPNARGDEAMRFLREFSLMTVKALAGA